MAPDLGPGPIDRRVPAIAEPKRLRDKAHLRTVFACRSDDCSGNEPNKVTAVLRARNLALEPFFQHFSCEYTFSSPRYRTWAIALISEIPQQQLLPILTPHCGG